MEMKSYVEDVGNRRFSDTGRDRSSGPIRGVDSGLFNGQGVYPQPVGALSLNGKEAEGVVMI
ncbi:hypothetical protein Ancab_031421 [Ancistrocladus abbreviatus]